VTLALAANSICICAHFIYTTSLHVDVAYRISWLFYTAQAGRFRLGQCSPHVSGDQLPVRWLLESRLSELINSGPQLKCPRVLKYVGTYSAPRSRYVQQVLRITEYSVDEMDVVVVVVLLHL
jgi:hypothetical protein